MQGNTVEREATRSNGGGVVAASTMESTRKMDEYKATTKVFNGNETGLLVYRRTRQRTQSWNEKNPIQMNKSMPKDSIFVEFDGENVKEGNWKEVEAARRSLDDEEMMDDVVEKPVKEEEEEVEEKRVNEMPVQPPPSKDDGFCPASDEVEEEEMYKSALETGNRMQSIVDLVMWRDTSKSAFVFGFGSFFLISSSYAKDLDFSLISAVSYLGLGYLALIFIHKSFLCRGVAMEYDDKDEKCMVGEEEVMWFLRLLLPYINEILLKTRALFNGDPATTMKLALLLFVMARCGSSITIWTLGKLVFFGVFTIPKVLSSYSAQLARYGKFWMERFSDGWESCTHKKAIAAAIFTLIWNLSSMIARIWAIFMLIVAVKFYQQCAAQCWNDEQEELRDTEDSPPTKSRTVKVQS